MRGRDVIMGILTQLSKGEGKTVVAFANTAG